MIESETKLNKTILVCFVAVAVAVVTFLIVDNTHGLFVDEDVLAEGREMGGFTQEMFDRFMLGEMKSAMASLAIWSAILAAAAGFVLPSSGSRWMGLAAGIIVGALGGMVAGYLCSWHMGRFEFRSGAMVYWSARSALTLAPIGAGVAMATAIGQKSAQALTDGLVSALIGVVATSAVYVGLMGLVTPNEDHSLLFPTFSSNRAILISLFSFVVLLMTHLSIAKSSAKERKGANAKTAQDLSESTEPAKT